jgi:subtilisin family serine protease
VARVLAALTLVALVISALPLSAIATGPVTQRWIVQLEPRAPLGDVLGTARTRLGVRPSHRFSSVLRGFAADLSDAQRKALLADPRVKAIVPDVPVYATGDPYPPTANEIQPGVKRVGALDNPDRAGTELDVDIAVLDTGMQPDNQELNIAGGYNCTDPTQSEAQRTQPSSWRDSASFGHGTHVAGIAAARENGRGVTGVAQSARLWAIKVLNGNGNGFWSWVICGLDRVAQMREPGDPGTPRVEVVNMSLAASGWDDGNCGLSNADLLHQAVCRLADKGVTMVAAAGNSSRDAAGYVPGAYDELITVSAMADWNGASHASGAPSGSPPSGCTRNYADDSFAFFSNYGPDVDLIAPGTCVRSTLPVDRLGLMTGTSMATPHVAGGAALYYLWEARAGRPRPTPEQVRVALIARGTHDWRTGTDPDVGRPGGAREPALHVADFDLAPGFEIGASPNMLRVAPGTSVEAEVWVARIGGFTEPVALSVDASSLPPGANASFDQNPSALPNDGTSLTIDVPSSVAAGTYDLQLDASAAGMTSSSEIRLVVYSLAVDAGAPWMRLRSGVTSPSDQLKVSIKWPRVSRARRYQLQQSVDGGPWATLGKPYRPKLNILTWPGRRYAYRVRAKVGGTWRDWKSGAALVTLPFEPVSGVTLSGNWSYSSSDKSYSEIPIYSTDAGARATLNFTGTSVAWIATRGPSRGRARVIVDGVHVTTIDLYASKTKHRQVVFSRSWDALGSHTIRIEVLGSPSSRPRVDIDALVIVSD